MPRNREEADLFFCSVTPLQNVRNENLGEGVAATSPPYPTPGWATTQVYPALLSCLLLAPRPNASAGDSPADTS